MIRKDLGADLTNWLDTVASDGMDIFLLEDDTVRMAVVTATRLVNQMRVNHRLGLLESYALGSAYMAGLLSTMQLKGRDKLSLELVCEGAMRGFAVEASALGMVRGYLYEDHFPLDSEPAGFDLSPYIGKGSMVMRRWPEGSREPFSGTTQIQSGSIAEIMSNHFKESEQAHTGLRLGMYFDRAGVIRGAAGVFIQAMPDANPQILEDLDLWLPQLPNLAKSLADGNTASNFVHTHFAAFQPAIVGSRSAEFSCNCERETFASYLRNLGQEQIAGLMVGDQIEILCHNCGTEYQFSSQDLSQM